MDLGSSSHSRAKLFTGQIFIITMSSFLSHAAHVIVTPSHLLASALLLTDLLIHSFRFLLASKNQFLFCKLFTGQVFIITMSSFLSHAARVIVMPRHLLASALLLADLLIHSFRFLPAKISFFFVRNFFPLTHPLTKITWFDIGIFFPFGGR